MNWCSVALIIHGATVPAVADALTALPSDTFRPEALRRALHKEGLTYDNARLRLLLTQLIRKGMVEVAEVGKGRNGSLYRRRSPPQPVEKTLLLQPPVNPG